MPENIKIRAKIRFKVEPLILGKTKLPINAPIKPAGTYFIEWKKLK